MYIGVFPRVEMAGLWRRYVDMLRNILDEREVQDCKEDLARVTAEVPLTTRLWGPPVFRKLQVYPPSHITPYSSTFSSFCQLLYPACSLDSSLRIQINPSSLPITKSFTVLIFSGATAASSDLSLLACLQRLGPYVKQASLREVVSLLLHGTLLRLHIQ